MSFERPDWWPERACAAVPTRLFFPDSGSSDPFGDTQLAKAVCAGCPVRGHCLDDAIDRRDDFGIYGGLTEKERRPIARARFGAMPQRARLKQSKRKAS